MQRVLRMVILPIMQQMFQHRFLKYYFKLASEEELLDGTAEDVGNSANAVTD